LLWSGMFCQVRANPTTRPLFNQKYTLDEHFFICGLWICTMHERNKKTLDLPSLHCISFGRCSCISTLHKPDDRVQERDGWAQSCEKEDSIADLSSCYYIP
jgi:hypothetical protein